MLASVLYICVYLLLGNSEEKILYRVYKEVPKILFGSFYIYIYIIYALSTVFNLSNAMAIALILVQVYISSHIVLWILV